MREIWFPLVVSDIMLAERGLKYGGVGPMHWNCFNCELYSVFLKSFNCKADFSVIYTASYLIFRYSLNVILEIFRSRTNNLVYFLNACTVPFLKPFHDQRFLNYTVRILNSWYPGYFSNHESFDNLIKVVTVKGWQGLSARFKSVWASVKGLLALKRFPDFFYILGTSLKNSIAVQEAFEMAIPVTGIISPDTATAGLYLPLRWPVTAKLVSFYSTIFFESIYYGLFKIFSEEFSLLTVDKLNFINVFASKLGEFALMKYRRHSLLSHWASQRSEKRIVGILRALGGQFASVFSRYKYKWIFFLKTVLFSIEGVLIRKSFLTHCLQRVSSVKFERVGILDYKIAVLQAFHVFKYLKFFNLFLFHSKVSFQNLSFQRGVKYKFSSFVQDGELRFFICRDRRSWAWLLNIWNMHFARCWKSFRLLLGHSYYNVNNNQDNDKLSVDSFYTKNFRNEVEPGKSINVKQKRRSFFFSKAVKSLFFTLNIVRSKYIKKMPRLFVSAVVASFQRAVMPVHRLLWEKVSSIESEAIAIKKTQRLASLRRRKLFPVLRTSHGLSKRAIRLNSKRLLRGFFALDDYFAKCLRLWVRPRFNFGKALGDLIKDIRADSLPHDLYHPRYGVRLLTVLNARARSSYRKRIPFRDVWKNACMPFKWTGRTANEFVAKIKKLFFFKEYFSESSLLKKVGLDPFAPFSDPFDLKKEIELYPIRRATFKNLNFDQAWRRTLFFLHLFSEVRTERLFVPDTDDWSIYLSPLNHDFGDHFFGMKWKKRLAVFNPIRRLLSTFLYRARFLRNMKQDLIWQKCENLVKIDFTGIVSESAYCDWKSAGICQDSYHNIPLGLGGVETYFIAKFLKKVFYRVLQRGKSLLRFSNLRSVRCIVMQDNFLILFLQKLYLKSNLLLVISRFISRHFWSLNFPLYLSSLFFRISSLFLRINITYAYMYVVSFRHLTYRALNSYTFLIDNCKLFFFFPFLLYQFIIKFIDNSTLEKEDGSQIDKFVDLIAQISVWSFAPLKIFVNNWMKCALSTCFLLISLKTIITVRLFNYRIAFIPLLEFFKTWNEFYDVFLEGVILASYKGLTLFQQYQNNKAISFTITRFNRFCRTSNLGTLLKPIISHSVDFTYQFRNFNNFGLIKGVGFFFTSLRILKAFFVYFFICHKNEATFS